MKEIDKAKINADLCDILHCSIEKNGELYQKMVWCEELSELIKAITKESRYGLNSETSNSLTEEISDVLVCIEEMLLFYSIFDIKIENTMKEKIERTKKRLFQDAV